MSILLKNVNPTILGTVDTTIEVVNNITIGGLVGIGVAAPVEKLEIEKAGGANIKIKNTSGGKSALFGLDALGPFVKVSANDNTFQVRNLSDAAIFTVDHTNNRIGINITTPAAPLDVRSAGGIAVGTSTSGRWLAKTSSNDARFSIERFTNETASDGNIKFSVQSDGYVAIGAGASGARSHLDLAAGGSILTIGTSAAGGYLKFGANSIDNSIEYANNHLGYYTTQGLGHRFFSAGVERLRIGSSAISPAVPQDSRVSIYGRLRLVNTDGQYTTGIWFNQTEGAHQIFVGRTANNASSNLGFYHSGVWAFEFNSSAIYTNVPFVANKRIYVSETVSVDSSSTGQGLFFDTLNAGTFGIYKAPGQWGPTSYPSLRIAFTTGIRMGASFQYGGIQFFSDAGMVNKIASFGEGDTKFRAYVGSDLYATTVAGVSILTASGGFGSGTSFSIRPLTSSLASAPALVKRGDARPEMQMQSQSGTKMLHFLPPSDAVASPAQITSVRDDLALCVLHNDLFYEKMRISYNAITFGQNANDQSEILKIMTNNFIPSSVVTNYIRGNNSNLVINANGALYLNPDGGNTGDVNIRNGRLLVLASSTNSNQLTRIGIRSGPYAPIAIGSTIDAWGGTDIAMISYNEDYSFCLGNNLRLATNAATSNSVYSQVTQAFSRSIGGSAIVFAGSDHGQGSGSILFYSTGSTSTAGTITASSAAKMILDNTGRLGIGGVSPADKLDVISASGDNGIRITNTLNSANDTCVLRFIQASTQRAAIFTNQGTLYFSTTAGSSRLRIESTGNVGIGMGSTAATQPLQVNGVIYSSSGGFKFPDSTTQTTAATGGVAYGSATVFTANGTFTVPAGVTKIKVTVTGGGAGGAFLANQIATDKLGGGAGGTGIKWLAVSANQTYTVVVGAGGAGSSSVFAPPSPGISSSFTNLSGNSISILASGGSLSIGGAVTGADLNLKGGNASKALFVQINGQMSFDQIRGNSYWNQSYGSGGLGGAATLGGAGEKGVVVIEY